MPAIAASGSSTAGARIADADANSVIWLRRRDSSSMRADGTPAELLKRWDAVAFDVCRETHNVPRFGGGSRADPPEHRSSRDGALALLGIASSPPTGTHVGSVPTGSVIVSARTGTTRFRFSATN